MAIPKISHPAFTTPEFLSSYLTHYHTGGVPCFVLRSFLGTLRGLKSGEDGLQLPPQVTTLTAAYSLLAAITSSVKPLTHSLDPELFKDSYQANRHLSYEELDKVLDHHFRYDDSNFEEGRRELSQAAAVTTLMIERLQAASNSMRDL